MYPVKDFSENDRAKILEFIGEYPLATITALGEDGWPVATHVPILIKQQEDRIILRGHVMRKTDHWSAFIANPKVLATFHGPNCPVLASWYPETENGGTWNYMVAHAYGTVTMLPEEELVKILKELKDSFEGSSESQFDKLSPGYLSKMLPGIQAFEIEVHRLDAVFKLSQNRDDSSYTNIVRKLTERGGFSAEVAAKMKANRPAIVNY